MGGSDEQPWQQSYAPKAPVPPTPPTPVTPIHDQVASTTPTSDDVGGGTPGEQLSDEQEAPHHASSPDAPLEVNEIDAQPDEGRL